MKATNNYRYSPDIEPALREVRHDYLEGVWKSMTANPKYDEFSQKNNEVSREAPIKPYSSDGLVPPSGRSMIIP